MSKDDKPVLKPFNLLDKRNLGENIADAPLQTEAQPLLLEPFIGASVYAIYYTGSFSAYGRLAEVNFNEQFLYSVYVGKSTQPGARKGCLSLEIDLGQALYKKFAEHTELGKAAQNLDITNSYCCFLVVDDIWLILAK